MAENEEDKEKLQEDKQKLEEIKEKQGGLIFDINSLLDELRCRAYDIDM